MNAPLEVNDGKGGVRYAWYRSDCPHRDGAHWLPVTKFDALVGGELYPIMGIRYYPTEEAARGALR